MTEQVCWQLCGNCFCKCDQRGADSNTQLLAISGASCKKNMAIPAKGAANKVRMLLVWQNSTRQACPTALIDLRCAVLCCAVQATPSWQTYVPVWKSLPAASPCLALQWTSCSKLQLVSTTTPFSQLVMQLDSDQSAATAAATVKVFLCCSSSAAAQCTGSCAGPV